MSASVRRVALLGCLGLFACDAADDSPSDAPDTFIATRSDFVGFGDWERFTIDEPAVVPNHLAGFRTIYLNDRPPAGATEFPVGTMIVKWADGDLEAQFHAMVKRGGDYNVDGAYGWEWFDLTYDDNGDVVIRWRGIAPPDGECYGCAPGVEAMTPEGGDCNTCHASADDNDWVHRTMLDLDTIAR